MYYQFTILTLIPSYLTASSRQATPSNITVNSLQVNEALQPNFINLVSQWSIVIADMEKTYEWITMIQTLWIPQWGEFWHKWLITLPWILFKDYFTNLFRTHEKIKLAMQNYHAQHVLLQYSWDYDLEYACQLSFTSSNTTKNSLCRPQCVLWSVAQNQNSSIFFLIDTN